MKFLENRNSPLKILNIKNLKNQIKVGDLNTHLNNYLLNLYPYKYNMEFHKQGFMNVSCRACERHTHVAATPLVMIPSCGSLQVCFTHSLSI